MTEWQRGMQAFREGRLREASDRLSAAIADADYTITRAVRFQTLAYLGAALYAQGRAAESIDAFEGAIQFAAFGVPPADLCVNLANAYLAVGRRSDARAALQRALATAPGHVEARMMLERLGLQSETETSSGFLLGDSPESMKKYLKTVVFSTVSSGGFDPAQVRQVLSQVERYLDSLVGQLAHKDEMIAHQETELVRLRQMEDRVIEEMRHKNGEDEEAPVAESLSPLEALFRQKS